MEDAFLTTRQGLTYISAAVMIAALAAFWLGFAAAAYGLALGGLTGLVSLFQLRYQLKRCLKLSPAAAVGYIQTGWLVRLLLIVCMLVISMVLPQISFIAALCGLGAVWLFLLVYSMLKVLKTSYNYQ